MDNLDVLMTVMPELVLAISTCALLLIGVFKGDKSLPLVVGGTGGALLGALLVTFLEPDNITMGIENRSLLISDGYIRFAQAVVLLLTFGGLLSSYRYLIREKVGRFEYPILIMISALGMIMLIAANDLLLFFVGLELQSLPVYILVAMLRNKSVTIEAAVKYFILGGLATILILYGASFIYGYTGTTEFYGIKAALESEPQIPYSVVWALVLILAGMAFKISAVPFHMWTPDVYEGAPTPVTLFIATAPKVAAMVFMIRFLFGPFADYVDIWQPLVQGLAILSMLLGVFAALFQTNLKRLLAYSAIAHVGYALIGVSCASLEGVHSVLIYIVLYALMALGAFSCLMHLRRHGETPVHINDLKGLSKLNPHMALALAILMFSLAGIPPLAGFFAKFTVFLAAVDAGLYPLAILGVLTTVIGATYYLRIIKVMYFDGPVGGDATLPYDRPLARETALVIAVSAGLNLFYFLFPEPLVSQSEQAATILFEQE
ncbi:MAG: NADH-quinone oxidoreductase subunit NuoN [Pseudomonadota bacterium]